MPRVRCERLTWPYHRRYRRPHHHDSPRQRAGQPNASARVREDPGAVKRRAVGPARRFNAWPRGLNLSPQRRQHTTDSRQVKSQKSLNRVVPFGSVRPRPLPATGGLFQGVPSGPVRGCGGRQRAARNCWTQKRPGCEPRRLSTAREHPTGPCGARRAHHGGSAEARCRMLARRTMKLWPCTVATHLSPRSHSHTGAETVAVTAATMIAISWSPLRLARQLPWHHPRCHQSVNGSESPPVDCGAVRGSSDGLVFAASRPRSA